MRTSRPLVSLGLLLFGLCGCAARATTAPRDPTAIDMEAMRIVASGDGQGGYEFTAYDAPELFDRGNREVDAGRCEEGVAHYDQLVREFPDSVYVSPALYNAGLCLAQGAQAARALAYFERLIRDLPDSADVKHASFQAGHLAVELGRWEAARAHADRILLDPALPADERVEALAVRTQALVGEGALEQAAQQAEEGLRYYRIQGQTQVPDPYFAAALNYSLAETIRLRAEALTFPDTTQEEQRAVLVRRAELLLEAQRAYFDTIRHTDPHWAAAAGHRIGSLYDGLWHDLMAAPVPAHLSEGAKEVYPQELAKLIKPLLRHAVRYWELTVMMIERTGVETPWADATRDGLERTRALLLEQPPGPGGLPAEAPQPPSDTPKTPASSPP